MGLHCSQLFLLLPNDLMKIYLTHIGVRGLVSQLVMVMLKVVVVLVVMMYIEGVQNLC